MPPSVLTFTPSGVGAPKAGARPDKQNGEERFRFAVPAKLAYRDPVRSFVQSICLQLVARAALSEKEAHEVLSAFVEAFNNAVIHAYEGQDPGSVEVLLTVGFQALQLEVRDGGRTFVPEDVPEPDLDSLPEGGLGLFIIRNFMDELRYERIGLQNVLTMKKLLLADPLAGASREA